MRGATRCANEVVFGLLSPTWRLDPAALACLGPIAQAIRALRASNVDVRWWRDAAAAVGADAGAARRGGPVASALAGMRALGLGGDLEEWAPCPMAPGGWRPLEKPWLETLRVLRAAWIAKEWRDLAGRRADLAHVAQGVDEYATLKLLRSGGLAADAAGALRT
eukprot:883856-Lingulodinium_polyedra.AAC.1